MKIYLLKQNTNNDYDTYDSMIVIAKDESDARKIHPDEDTFGKNNKWVCKQIGGGEYNVDEYYWCKYSEINQITVEYIGEASASQKRSVVLASFNAG